MRKGLSNVKPGMALVTSRDCIEVEQDCYLRVEVKGILHIVGVVGGVVGFVGVVRYPRSQAAAAQCSS